MSRLGHAFSRPWVILTRTLARRRARGYSSESPMAYHVDVIQTDWAAGVERLAARLVPNGRSGTATDTSDPDGWAGKLLHASPDQFGEMAVPDAHPNLFLLAFV